MKLRIPIKTMVLTACSICNNSYKAKVTGLQAFKNASNPKATGSFLDHYFSESQLHDNVNFNICKKCKKIQKQKGTKNENTFKSEGRYEITSWEDEKLNLKDDLYHLLD